MSLFLISNVSKLFWWPKIFKKCFLNGFKTKTVGAFIRFSTSFLTLLKELNLELPAGLPGLPWWLRWWRIRLWCGRPGLIPGLRRSPGGGNGNPLQYSCLENPHGQRSLVGYSPWGCKESDMTEWLSTAQWPSRNSWISK